MLNERTGILEADTKKAISTDSYPIRDSFLHYLMLIPIFVTY